MLSYVHAFHAGNFADVHKHVVVSLVLSYLARKPAPMSLCDFYAGAGCYDLHSAAARKTAEADAGIGQLWPTDDWPEALADYARVLTDANPGAPDNLAVYPGSPQLLAALARPQDALLLVEMHPDAHTRLRALLGADARARIHRRDAHEAMPALVPPQHARGLVLVDPSYEGRDEFRRVTDTLVRSLGQWRHGSWCIWYPLLSGNPHRPLVDRVLREAGRDVLVSELRVPVSDDRMHGSGMLVINPTWGLDAQLAALAPWFARLGDGAGQLKNRLHVKASS